MIKNSKDIEKFFPLISEGIKALINDEEFAGMTLTVKEYGIEINWPARDYTILWTPDTTLEGLRTMVKGTIQISNKELGNLIDINRDKK